MLYCRKQLKKKKSHALLLIQGDPNNSTHFGAGLFQSYPFYTKAGTPMVGY